MTMPWQGTEVPNKIEATLNVDYQAASMIWLPDINKNQSRELSQSMEAVTPVISSPWFDVPLNHAAFHILSVNQPFSFWRIRGLSHLQILLAFQ